MNSNKKLKLFQCIRVLFAFLIPLPFIVFAYVWHVVNAFYHPDTYDAQSYWLSSIPWVGVLIAIGLFVGIWKFRSEQVGRWMAVIGGLIFVVLGFVVWSVL